MKNINPTNIDFLMIGNGCNLSCQQCYAGSEPLAKLYGTEKNTIGERQRQK